MSESKMWGVRYKSIFSVKGLTFSIILLLAASHSVAQPEGEKIFKNTCATCHKIDVRLTGPPLRGAIERAPSQEWLLQWVKKSEDLVAAGDTYAVKIFNEYNKIIMPPQALTDEEILAVFDYIENTPLPKENVALTSTSKDEGTVDGRNKTLWLALIALALLIVIWVQRAIKRKLKLLLDEKQGLEPTPPRGIGESMLRWIATHKKYAALIFIVLMVASSVKGWYVLKGIGVYQGYAPEQPIRFSHKIHAGDNAINCVYCHSGAEKGRVSGIPPVNVCMNCHRGISSGKQWGTAEISKIYEAAGWNPEKQQYDRPGKPISWVRVHNLPDFTYFNHAQHVVVGKQKCQTCHGPVETFDVMKQYAPLTMGWCVNCHRTAQVEMKGNAYYDKLHSQLVKKYGKQRDAFFVQDIGGLECVKCHY